MGDSELEAIRQQRLAQMQAQYNKEGGAEGQRAREEQARAQEDARNGILVQVMDQNARARLNTLMLTKPEKGKMVENMLIRMAQSGQICKKITEAELISLLENVNSQMPQTRTTVKFDRRRAAIDSDDDDI